MEENTNTQTNRSLEMCRRVVTTESLIAEAREIYRDLYDYSKVEYINREHMVTVGCRVHGDFRVYARDHLDGKGCPKCEKGERFIKKLQDKFGDKFGLEQFVYESSTSPVTLVCKTHGAFSRLPNQILNSSLGCPECANDIIRDKQEAAKKAMEGKRLNATKAGIERFRNKHPEFTDEHIEHIVESSYPNFFESNFDAAIEVVKELYRRQAEWTDESFLSLLHEMKGKGWLDGFSIETKRESRRIINVQNLIERIYKEAQTKTIYLSKCPEYEDEDVKQYFREVYSDKGSTLAQKFFYLLNNRALRDSDQPSGFVLPFHCYSEPNGDVVFTKNRRTRSDYDAAGRPTVSEKDIVNGGKGGGCLGVVFVLIALCATLFVGCRDERKIGPFESEKVSCIETMDTILAHIPGMAVVDSFFNEENFYNTKESDYYRYILVARVSDGKDTLMVVAEESSSYWSARVSNPYIIISDVEKIKRHNLLMKELFANDSCFTLDAGSDKIIRATFRKEKPKEPERPLEDYGLDENDL